jgi:uncharacterized OB-fold protein
MTGAEAGLWPRGRYEAALAEGRLPFDRCAACGAAQFPPRVLCRICGSDRLDEETSSGRGVVYSRTVVRGRERSDLVVLVDLDEGFRMMSTVVGAAIHEVAIGDRVRNVIEERDGAAVPVFIRDEAS